MTLPDWANVQLSLFYDSITYYSIPKQLESLEIFNPEILKAFAKKLSLIR
jgi:hypothetical protein